MAIISAVAACAHAPDERETTLKEDFFAFHDKTAKRIDEFAEKIDLYASNRDDPIKPNNSQITIHNGATITEDGKRAYAPRVGVKLHLPNLQRKLQLRFTNYDETREDRGINENRYRPETAQERNYGTSLALFQSLGKLKTEFRPRADFVGSKIATAYLFKFSSSVERGAFSIDPELQLFARSDAGTGQFFALDPVFAVTPDDKVTILIEEQYTDADNTTRTNHGPRWVHAFTDRFSDENAVIFESTNRDTYHLEQVVYSSSFHYVFWRNILNFVATPYFTMPKGRKFKAITALDLGVDLVF